MSKTSIYKAIVLFLIGIPLVLQAGDFGDIKVIKTIEKSYRLGASETIEVANKYGKIHVNTWSKSQVSVEIIITSYGRTEESAQARINALEIDERRPSGRLSLATLTPKDSRVRLDKKGLSVTYEINLPASHPLVLNNRFGDIYLQDRQGKVDLNLHHGLLTTGRLSHRQNRIVSNFGKANIDFIAGGRLDFSYGKLFIDRARDIYLKTNSTEVGIDMVETLELKGNLGDIKIGQVNTLTGSYSSSCFQVEHLGSRLDMEVKYASCFKIEEVGEDFQRINLTSNYCVVHFGFDDDSHFNLEANTINGKLKYQGKTVSMTILESGDLEKKITYLGKFGQASSLSPRVVLNCSNGHAVVNQ